MRPRPFSSYSKSVTGQLCLACLCSSPTLFCLWGHPRISNTNLIGEEFPLRRIQSKVSGLRVTHIFHHSHKWREPPRRSLFFNPIAGTTFAESNPCSFFGLCLDVHAPFLPLLILLNLITCRLGNILNTSLKTKNKSIVHRRNGGRMNIVKHREEWRASRDEASDVFVAVSMWWVRGTLSLTNSVDLVTPTW